MVMDALNPGYLRHFADVTSQPRAFAQVNNAADLVLSIRRSDIGQDSPLSSTGSLVGESDAANRAR